MVSITIHPKSTPKNDTDKYEVKSDILNFDYMKLSYPASSTSLGIKKENSVILKERKPGKKITDEDIIKINKQELVDGVTMIAKFILIGFCCFIVFALVPGIIIILVTYKIKNSKHPKNN
jgi:hypothetical protein